MFLSYERARFLKVTIIHGMARMAAIMASSYKAYLGVGLDPFSLCTCYYLKNWTYYIIGVTHVEYSKNDNVNFRFTLHCLTKFGMPHPGRVGGRFFIDIAMPLMLSWVLGGNRLVFQNHFVLLTREISSSPYFCFKYLRETRSNHAMLC